MKHTLSTSKGLHQSLGVSIGNITTAAISAVSLIILSRILGPHDFGIFSAVFSLMLLITKLSDFGINIALQRSIAQDQQKARSKGAAVFQFKLLVWALIFILGSLFSPQIATLLHIPNNFTVYTAISLSGLSLLFEYSVSFLNGLQHFAHGIVANLIQSLIKLLAVITSLFLYTLNANSAIVIYSTAPLFGLIYALPQARFKLSFKLSSLKFYLNPIFQVAKFTGISSIALAVADNIDVIFIKYFLTNSHTGYYAAASKIIMFLNFTAMSFLIVLSVRVAKYTEKVHLDSYLKKAKLFALTGFVVVICLIPFASSIIGLTTGSQYLAAVPSLNILLIASAIFIATIPFYALFYLYSSPSFYSYYGMILLTLLIILDILFIPQFGIIGAAYAQVIMRAVLLIFTLLYSKHQFNLLYNST